MNSKRYLLARSFRNMFAIGILLITVIGILSTAILLFVTVHDVEVAQRLTETIQTRRFIFSIIVTCIMVGVVGYIFAYFQLLPLKRFDMAMKEVSHGDFSIRISPDNGMPHEVKELVNSFNIMVNELENTELLKQNFINDFSHEFKTPISSINGFANILIKNDLTQEQRQEYLQLIASESQRLVSLSKNILLLNKIESQDILSDITHFNLAEQIRLVILSLNEYWEKRSIEFDLRLDELYYYGNHDLIKQLWLNLIENAIKFSQNGETILISLNKEHENITFKITNYGEVIENKNLSKLFDKFYQVNESRDTNGNGIGLSIAKKICQLHKAEINVQSDLNTGTTFTVVFNSL